MTATTITAIIILALLLCFWKHIAALLLDLHADYRIWKALTADGLEHRSFVRYLWEECL